MRFCGVTAIGALLCLSAPAQAELVVNISKSEQRLAVFVDGTEAYRWPVSTGRPGFQTPTRSYRPIRLEPNWYSHRYNMTPMPWSVFFYRGYALHGTREAYNLGRAVSHGCVRLRPDNAEILFSMIRHNSVKNIKLVVTDGPLPRARHARGVPMAAVEPQAPRTAEKTKTEKKSKAENVENAKTASKPSREGGERHLSAKANAAVSSRKDDDERDAQPRSGKSRVASIETYSVSNGSDEARILREREAWLRSIDCKYGIAR